MPVVLPVILELSRRMVDAAPAELIPATMFSLMVEPSTVMLMVLAPAATMPLVRLLEMTLLRTVIEIVPFALLAASPFELNWMLLFSIVTRALPPTWGWITMPPPLDGRTPFDVIELFLTSRTELPVLGSKLMPAAPCKAVWL